MAGAETSRRARGLASAAAAAALVVATPVRARPAEPPPPVPHGEPRRVPEAPATHGSPASTPDRERHWIVSLTVSPLHFVFLPPLQLAVEVRPVAHLGVAAVGAMGPVDFHIPEGDYETYLAYKIGGDLVGYVLPGHPFDAVQVGAQVLYAHVAKPRYDPELDASNDGLAIGPFVGFKVIASCGFTAVGQMGFEYVAARAHPYSHDSAGKRVGSGTGLIPIVNVDIGWSF